MEPLRDLCAKITDGTHRSPKTTQAGYLYVTSRNIRPFKLDLGERLYISERDHREIYNRCDVRFGDVLLTKDGVNTGNALVNPLQEAFSLLSSVALIRPDPTRLDANFLCQFLNGPEGRQQSVGAMDGLAIRRLTIAKIQGLRAPVPPLPEQRKIAAVLSSVDDAIEKTQAVIEQVQVVKKGLMQELLTRGLPGRHTKFKRTEIGEVPEEWEVVPLGDALDGIDAGWSPVCEARPAAHHEWGVLKLSSVTSGRYVAGENKALTSGLEPRAEIEVHAGEVLVARANGVLDLVGRSAFVYETRPRLMLSDKTLRLRPITGLVDPLFIHLLLNSPPIHDQALQRTTGSHMRNISQSALKSVPIPIPPLDEQVVLSSVVRDTDRRETDEARYLDQLHRVKSALMSVLLTGEVRVTPDSEAA